MRSMRIREENMTKFSRLTSLATVALGALLYPLSLAAYQDAPMLQGKGLPLVAERLPDQPEVIKQLQEVGSYGGTMRRFLSGSNDHNSILRFGGRQGLTRWKAVHPRRHNFLGKDYQCGHPIRYPSCTRNWRDDL